MGMSASQARLIALTERMNDIEYQGQQINQQRTTLSNQVNALYNSLLEMNVPTPPSTKDYQKVIYAGTLGASKYTVDASDIVPKADNKYTITLGMKSHGNTVSKGTGYATVDTGVGSIKGSPLTPVTINATTLPASSGLTTEKSSDGKAYTSIGARVANTNYNDTYNAGRDVVVKKGNLYYQLSVNEAFDHTDKVDEKYGSYQIPDDNTLSDDPEGAITDNNGQKLQKDGKYYHGFKTVEIKSQAENDTIPENAQNIVKYTSGSAEKTTLKSGYTEVYEIGTGTDLYLQETGEAKQGIKSASLSTTYVIENDGSVRMANTSDFTPTGDGEHYILRYDASKYVTSVAGDTEYKMQGASNLTVNGKATYTFDELEKAGYDNATISEYKNAIANSGICDTNGKNYSWENFMVVFNGDGKSPSFVLKDDLLDGNNNCEIYDYSPNGDIDLRSTMDNCLLTFDAATGQITSMGIPKVASDGSISYTTIKMEATTDTDDVAYKEAYSQYEYKKLLYDEEQNEINKKTSIIQAEDKSLELKLTRLDNERNAVNTEIDAVKKVVEDNIEKSYKTFSG